MSVSQLVDYTCYDTALQNTKMPPPREVGGPVDLNDHDVTDKR
jgi:hypothetical protein